MPEAPAPSSAASTNRPAGRGVALGLFLVSSCVLAVEVGLTRILSVTIWYHFSFAAVSVALLGMSAGSVRVYVRRARWIDGARGPLPHLVRAASIFALTLPAATALYLALDLSGGLVKGLPWLRIVPALIFVIPFYFGGVVVSLVLTAYPRDVGRLYFWDLVGAGLGGLALVLLLGVLSGPSVLLLMGAVGAVAALCFAQGGAGRRRRAEAWLSLALTAGLLAANLAFGWISVRYTKTHDEGKLPLLHEKWGPMARVTVFDHGFCSHDRPVVHGWGISSVYDGPVVPELFVEQDSSAGTVITRYEGDPAKLPHLAYDVTAVGYTLLGRPGSGKPSAQAGQGGFRVAVIGAGGGRDVLTALHFGAGRVVAIEVNPDMVALVDHVFADFAGHLYDDPRVEAVVADGRSYLARTRERFDLIQVSLIDSWAASAAGAYVLAENSLYTEEAFETYWSRLREGGLLSFTRWAMSRRPGELLRLVSLARITLRRHGVRDPGRHLAVITYRDRVGTVLLRKQPFTGAEVARLKALNAGMGFRFAWAPDGSESWPAFGELMAARDLEAYWAAQPMDISPPTDDRPFFFLILRLGDALDAGLSKELGLPNNATAVRTLMALLVGVLCLTVLLILVPLRYFGSAGLDGAPHRGRLLLYFACLGLGYILVEIPLIQRLILFLGHPIYALSVVLCTLLLSSGLGSLLVHRVAPAGALRRARVVLPAVAAVALLYTFGLVPVLDGLFGLPLGARIGAAVVLLAPLGLLMGMPFPLGIKVVDHSGARSLVPWVWGVNGATSVVATVLAFVLALAFGYRNAMTAGAACYGVAWATVLGWKRAEVSTR